MKFMGWRGASPVTEEVPMVTTKTATEKNAPKTLTRAECIAMLCARLADMEAGAVGEVVRFSIKFEEDPEYAFRWADNAMSAAATLKAVRQTLGWLKKDAGFEDV